MKPRDMGRIAARYDTEMARAMRRAVRDAILRSHARWRDEMRKVVATGAGQQEA